MSVFTVAILSFLFSLFIGKLLIPHCKKREFRQRAPEMARLGWISALSFLRYASLTAAWTFLAIGAVFKVTNLIARVSGNTAVTDRLITGFGNFNHWFEGIKEGRYLTVLIVLSIILLILFYRQGKMMAKGIYEQLIVKYNNDQLTPFPPNEKMKSIWREVEEREVKNRQIMGIPEDELTSEGKERQREWLEASANISARLKDSYAIADVDRRILEEWSKQEEPAIKSNWWNKILTFFISEGTVKLVHRSNRTLSRIGIALLVLSFVGAAGSSIVNITNNTVRQLVGVHVQLERNDFEDWQETMIGAASAASSTAWQEEDEEIVDALARDFELAFAYTLLEQSGNTWKVKSPDNFRIRAHAVRTNILTNYQNHANTSAPQTRSSTTGSAGTAERYRAYETRADFHGESNRRSSTLNRFAERFERQDMAEHSRTKPQSEIGRKYRQRLQQQARRYPAEVWSSIKSKYRSGLASFGRAASPREVFGMTISQAIDGIANDVFKGTTDNLGDALQRRIAKQMSAGTMKNWVELNMENYTRELITRPDMESVRKGYTTSGGTPKQYVQYEVRNSGIVPSSNAMNSHLSNHPPFLDRIDRNHGQLRNMDRSLRQIATRNNRPPAQLANSANSFKSLFPGSPGADLHTVSGSMANNLTYNSDYVDPIKTVSSTANTGAPSRQLRRNNIEPNSNIRRAVRTQVSSNLAATRARSFASLRGFRRIGGVLIGQNPVNGGSTGVEIVALDWKSVGNSVKITLTDSEGLQHDAGTYDQDIAYQALAYAADGRPVAATMIKVDIPNNLKILVHPALIDTELGCQAIAVDRFVDVFAGRHPEVNKALTNANLLNVFYRYSACRMMANSDQVTILDRAQYEAFAESMEIELVNYFSGFYRYYAPDRRINDPAYSFIAATPSLYNTALWKTIQSSLLACRGDLEVYKSKLAESAINFSSLEDLLKTDVAFWSGVREVPYKVDKEMNFLRDNNNGMNSLRFMEQVAYIPMEETEEENFDPWEFPGLEATGIVEREVSRNVRRSTSSNLILRRMQSFTLAQRLFRAALSGDLGIDFPVERLSEFGNEFRNEIPWKLTPRFNGYISPEELEIIINTSTDNEQDAANLRTFIQSCGIMDEQNQDPCG